MKTRMINQMAITSALVMLLASCSPQSSKEAQQSFQTNSSQSNIVGGVDADLDYQKTNGIAGLMMISKNSKNEESISVCTTSLIAPQVVVTAAHCLVLDQDQELVAALIVLDTNFNKVLQEIQKSDLKNVRIVDNAKIHKLYVEQGQEKHDIALLSFQGILPADFQLVKLADANQILKSGDTLTLSGFGASEYKINPITKRPQGKGSGTLRHVDGIKVIEVAAAGDEITLDQSQGSGACHGDSGGPAYLKDATTGQNILVGVTSRTTQEMGLCDTNVIYTSTIGYADWIQENLKALQDEAEAKQAAQQTENSSQQVASH